MDRNNAVLTANPIALVSLSARRAWIEICVLVVQVLFDGSLSARRAWIEIPSPCATAPALTWSLSARRAWIEIRFVKVEKVQDDSRSPQGERG